MKVCGIELKGNEAIICLLYSSGSKSSPLYMVGDCRIARLTLSDVNSRQHLVDFQFEFAQLMRDYPVDHVVIRPRLMKGKFAGGAVSFKLEAAIQLIEELSVEVMPTPAIKAALKANRVPIAFEATGLKGFQKVAFETAFAYLSANAG